MKKGRLSDFDEKVMIFEKCDFTKIYSFRVLEPQNTKYSIGSRAVQRGGAENVKKVEIDGNFMNFIILAKKCNFHQKVETSRFCASGRLTTASTATAKVKVAFRAGRGKIAKNISNDPTFNFSKKCCEGENRK